MGYEVRREVRNSLTPGKLTAAERLLLLEIADYVNDKTREGWPGVEALAIATDIAVGSIPAMLGRIAEKWMDVRVRVGTDAKRRPVYARHGHRTVFRFPKLERFDGQQTSRLNDGQTSEPARFDEPTNPFDSQQTLEDGRFDSQQNKVCSSSTPSPQYTSVRTTQSLLRQDQEREEIFLTSRSEDQPPQPPPTIDPSGKPYAFGEQALINIGATHNEAVLLALVMTKRHQPQSNEWWRKVAANGDLADRLARYRRDNDEYEAEEARQRPQVQPYKPYRDSGDPNRYRGQLWP